MADKKTLTIPGGSEKDFIQDMLGQREESMQGLRHVHEEAMDDLKMLLNEDGTGQWNPEVLKYRQALVPPRPCLTQNLMPSFGDRVKNEQRQSRPQVKCNPVDDKADPHTATVIAGLIRNIHYQSQADAVHDLAYDSMVDCGLGAWRVISEYADPMSFDQELRIRPIGSAVISNPLSIWWDLTCKNFVTSDKKFCGIDSVMRKADAKKRFKRDDFLASADFNMGTSQADWFMEDSVRITEYLYVKETKKRIILLSNGQVREKKDGDEGVRKLLAAIGLGTRVIDERDTLVPEIQSCICSGSEVLEGPFLIPGRYIPIVITFGKILNEQGKLHIKSLHRDAKSIQEVHNYLISSLVEQFALQPSVPWTGTPKMFEGFDKIWERANEGGLSYLPYNPDPSAPSVKPTRESPPTVNGQLFGWISQNMSNMRDVYGIHEAGLGMVSNETSGKAINARKASSDLGTLVFMANHMLGLQFEGNILADQIPHYYDAPRAQMITGLEGESIKVMLNQAFTVNTKNGPKQMMYDMKTGKYDVVMTVGPTATTQRDETSQLLGEMIQAVAPANPVGGQILAIEQVKLINTPNNERLVKLLKMTLPPEIRKAMDEETSGIPGASGNGGPDEGSAQMQQELEQMTMQMQQLQTAHEQMQAENMALKQEEQSRIAKIEADRSMNAEKIALERERIEADIVLKREASQQEYELKIQKIEADRMLADKKATAELVHRDRLDEANKKPDEEQSSATVAEMQQQIAELTRSVEAIASGR
jgi:hypothetical protein